MALTVTDTAAPLPNVKVSYAAITFDSSYPTGGEAIAASDFGLRDIHFLDLEPRASGYVVQYNRSTGKLQVYVEEAVAAGGALVEVANTTDLSALIVDALAWYFEGGVDLA